MATKTPVGIEEYLRSSFEPDAELVDGEIVERPMGELPHSYVQGELTFILRGLAPKLGIQVLIAVRIQTQARRFRVADLAVFRAGDIGEKIPSVPPFLVVEILSPEDRMVRVQAKVQEYLELGVEYVWLIDPDERQAIVYSRQAPAGRVEGVLRTQNPDIEIELPTVLPA